MKAILKYSSSNQSQPLNKSYYQMIGHPEIIQDFSISKEGLEFDVRMRSTKGFEIPNNCDVDVEMKFTFIPKIPKPTTVILS